MKGNELKIQTEFLEDHQVKVISEFESDLLQQFKQRAAKKIAQKTKIPGFRPGKAPYAIIVAQVGESAIYQEAIDLMLDDVYPKVIEEAGVKPFGPGNLESIDSEDPPIFTFVIPLEPKVSLGDYRSLRKEYHLEPLDDKTVDDFILQIRRNSATIVPITGKAQEGNVVFVEFHAKLEKPKKDEEATVIESTTQQLLIPTEDELRDSEWPFKGFTRNLIGKKEEEVVTFSHKYPKDHEDEKLKNKLVNFVVTIKSVKGLDLPELEGEFLKSLGDYESGEQFREVASQKLSDDAKAAYDDAYYLDLVDQIRDISTIKYPPQMLDEEVERILQRVEADLKRQNLDLDTYLKIRKMDRDAFIKDEIKPTAILRLERSLVMDQLAKDEEIKLDNQNIQLTVEQIIQDLAIEGSLNDIQKEMGENKFINAVTMESINRVMENQIRLRLKEIATDSWSDKIEDLAVEESEEDTSETKNEEAQID